MNNKIVWEKWVDPFINEITTDGQQEKDDSEDAYKDSYERAEEKSKGVTISDSGKNYSGPVMIGPMGIIPLNESNLPSKVYCFWMGHTNFDITRKVQNAIAKVPGVESLDVFTRYRFRLSIGKAFIDENKDPFGKNVLLEVEKAVCPKESKEEKVVAPIPSPAQNNLCLIKKHLNKTYKYWIIFAKADGTLETKGAATKEELITEFDNRTDEAVATSWE